MDRDRNYYGGGGGRSYHRGGGGRHRNSRGRGRGHRHQPYNRSRGGGGGNRGGRSNRFGQQQQLDPETVMMRQIASFLSRVGEFQNLRAPTEEEAQRLTTTLRNVEFTTASNINDLLPILCAPDKLELLMKYSAEATKVEDKVGKLVHLIIGCVTSLPLQTPCYAALTLAVHENVKENPACSGFATRCIQYAMLQIAKELDTSLLTSPSSSTTTPARSICQIKLMLRYLCILSQVGIIPAYEGETTVDPNKMTVLGFFSVLVDAATAAAGPFNSPCTGYFLASAVLSTLPYVMELQGIPREVIEEKLQKPIETLLGSYKSTFTPGTGMTALLLKEPQAEDDDEDEDEDEDDEDDEEESGQICDSLQDLARATKYWRKEGQVSTFTIPTDAPWKGLLAKTMSNPDSGEEPEIKPVTYSEGPLYLSFPQPCELLNLLLGGAGSNSPMKLQCFSLEGITFGRLPIFGSPPDPEDNDEDDEEEMEDGAPKNESLQAFKEMSLLDRYFVAETVRDCLISHESHVNPTGLQMGSAKAAADELLRVCHVFSSSSEGDPQKGMEFAILETILALLAQSNEHSSLRHSYLSRVLLELTRLEPSRLSQALAIAMTNLFEDYLPALVPAARENFSGWFAFHLINTDYQWPSAYWQLWEPYATSEKDSSRGIFVRRALNIMAENLCDPSPISKQCFQATTPSLSGELVGRTLIPLDESTNQALEVEIQRRLWDNQEDPTSLLDFFKSDEVMSSLQGSTEWARTDALVRVLMQPAKQLYDDIQQALEKSKGDTEAEDGDMEEDSGFSKDVHAVIIDCLVRYKDTIRSVVEMDAGALSSGADSEGALLQGGAFILRRVESLTSFNSALLEGIVASFVKNRIVKEMSVLRWLLRDVGDSVLAPVVAGWSNYAMCALRESLQLVAADSTANGTMGVDGSEASKGLAQNALTTVLSSFQYAIQRVCSVLVTTQMAEKKLKSTQVDLVEGLKTYIINGKRLFIDLLTQPMGVQQGMSLNEVLDNISKSELAGTSLASYCGGEDTSTAVRILKLSLENA